VIAMTDVDPRLLEFVAGRKWGVLATVKRDGRPQVSNIGYAYDPGQQLFRISVTADRAKTRNLERDARLTLHVSSDDFWSWVAVEGTADLTPVAAAPDDATVDELVAYYRGVNGEHEDWDDYRAAMVRDRRLVVRFRPEHAYGQLP
jgi:PPOX class probable F420-dependent enzyme